MKLSKNKVYSILLFVFAIFLAVMYLIQPVWNKAKAGGVGFSILLLAIAVITFIRDDNKEDNDLT